MPDPATPPESAPLSTVKHQLRAEMRAALGQLEDRPERSQRICRTIAEQSAWADASIVAVFAPMKSEPDVELLWSLAASRTLCVPRLRGGHLEYLAIASLASLVTGPRGFREPSSDGIVIAPNRFDLVLVPGVAFSTAGERLGRGGGYYDRLLAGDGLRAATIGICFDVQLVPSIPGESHDRKVDRVITESGVQT
ncbi:MAG: 5-formyltetrahydrofolate cyclo-ligase [Chthoniobacteraceae bacterium]